MRARAISIAVLAAVVGVMAGDDLGAQQREPAPPRQNPNINRPITNEGFDSTVIMLLQRLVAAYGPIADSNDRPNPYTRVEPFGDPPPGNNGEWAAVIGAEGGPDGSLYVLHRCQSNSCVGRPEAPIVKLDPRTGRRLATWGEGLTAFPHGLHVDREGNVWTADVGRGDAPGGHVVRKFSADGELLMTIGQSGVAGGTGRGSSVSRPTSRRPATAPSSSPRGTSRTAPTRGSRSTPRTAPSSSISEVPDRGIWS